MAARSARPGHPGAPATPRPARRGRSAGAGVSLPDLIGRNFPLPLPVPDWSKPIILGLLLVAGGLGVRTRVTSVRARRLERTREALTADIGAMQLALVPEIPPRVAELGISVAYRPADGPAAGGDFYDAFALEGGRVAIILGDVSGHGRAALAQAAQMRYTVRAYLEAGLAPREALKLAASVSGRNVDGRFATVAAAVHDPSTAALTYAMAGHPPPLTLVPAAHEPLTICASPALGWGFPSGRRQTTLSFPAGARACFFSDGLIEARTAEALLGRDGLATIFAELGSQASARSLLDQVRAHAREVRDDMAACIIEALSGSASQSAETCLEEFELDLEQLSLGHGESFLRACGIFEHEIPHAIDRASAVAAEHGLAVLTVAMPGRRWSVSPSLAPMFVPPTTPVPRVVAGDRTLSRTTDANRAGVAKVAPS